MSEIVPATLQPVIGGIVIAVILLIVFPVAIMMSGAVFAALLGTSAKKSVDRVHKRSELLEISEANPYKR